MKRVRMTVVLAGLMGAMLGLTGHGQETNGRNSDPSSKDISELMKRKLDNSQKVLEGVVINDFDKISKHAQELIFVSKQAEWRILKTPEYEVYTNQFRRNAADLIEKAKDKNLDGAALAYVDMTLTCVKCHKHVRDTRKVQLDLPEPAAAIATKP